HFAKSFAAEVKAAHPGLARYITDKLGRFGETSLTLDTVKFGDEDNYWPAGSALSGWVGPNGPCSEIFYDFGERACGHTVKCTRPGEHDTNCERFREVWNLVFPQFIRDADGNNPKMPAPGIDTGMGFDRLVAVLQEKDSVFATDLFEPLMRKSAEILKTGETTAAAATAQRIAADHARAATFLFNDGIVPSNEGRGYVLRRLIRRAVRQTALFGEARPIISELVPVIVEKLGGAYPEIRERVHAIRSALRQEEEIFITTLDRGLAELRKERDAGHTTLGGDRAFFFYDTFGFPRELTEDIWGREYRLALTPAFAAEYSAALEAQQGKARAAWKGSGERGVTDVHHALARELGATPFTGYDRLADDARVVAIVRGGARVRAAGAGETVEAVLDRTPFYAESGGQVADHG
ncbi:MAG: alanine--tRNA ligase-related protein, partial [bacterium]